MLSVYTVAMIRHPSLCRGRCHRHWSLVDEDLHRGTPGSVWEILNFETTISPLLSVIDSIASLALQPGVVAMVVTVSSVAQGSRGSGCSPAPVLPPREALITTNNLFWFYK